MPHSIRYAVALIFLALAPLLVAQSQPAPRRPRGIYAVVRLEQYISQQQQANPSITVAQLDAYFDGFFQTLLSNSAISGLALQVSWATLNPNPLTSATPYYWNVVDDAFAQVTAWNSQNPTQTQKSIQIILSAGFNSPPWMLAQIPSCDGLFATPSRSLGSCGSATFLGYSEGGGGLLPLPWNPFYKSSWKTFLTAVAARYLSNPAFVSIAVAGPTAASCEIILPNDANSNNPQTQFATPITPSNMWRQLLAFQYPGQAAYQNSDQAFIDEWDNAIDLYGQVFSGITLIVTTGNGLPNFNQNFTVPAAFTSDCPNPNMDCAAETTILSHFIAATVGGTNAKATQTSGMKGSRDISDTGDLGVRGAQWLSQTTAGLTAPTAQILGGAQFDTLFSSDPLGEGCTSVFPPNANDTPPGCTIPATCSAEGCLPVACIPQACLAPGVTQANLAAYNTFNKVPASDLIPPEQAEYNVLTIYFQGTPVASTFGGTQGTAPMNYLQVYSEDIQYAGANVDAPALIVEPSSSTVTMSAQALLNLASQQLSTIEEPPLLPSIPSGGIVPAAIQPGAWVSIYGANLASTTATWTGNFPSSLGGTSVTIDGRPAFLSYVSPGQINLQVPNDSTTGAVAVVVTTDIGSGSSTATLAPFSPLFFLLDTKHVAGIILRSNGKGAYGGGTYDIIGPTGSSLGYPTVAAKAGDVIELYGTGFGPTNPTVAPGQAYSGAAPTTNTVTLRINNITVPTLFTGLSGPGLYQLNLTVAAGLGTGDVPLQAVVGGAMTPTGVVISLQ